MQPIVTIIDYGVGNLLSVVRAFEHCGAKTILTDSPEAILNAERLVLPGVGAFKDGIDGLKQRGLIEPIRQYATYDKPFLGICLGMQMMLDSSEEFGNFEGLGLIPGKVLQIPKQDTEGKPHKIPHIGWNGLQNPQELDAWHESILNSVKPQSEVYFVHSYMAVPEHNEHRLADCTYGGQKISAALRKGNLFGCQFHPEKSGHIGLAILKNWISL